MVETLADRTRAELLRSIDTFLAARGMSESAFGLRSCNDVKIVRRIRTGGNVTLATIHRIEAWMAEQRAEERVTYRAAVAAIEAA